MGCFCSKYKMFELKKYRGGVFGGIKDCRKIFEGKLTCAFKTDMIDLSNFDRLKNSDFILESKMAELNQNKIQNN